MVDNKTLAKLALLANKNPAVAETLSKQAAAVSDDELEKVAGGDVCFVDSPCWITSRCLYESDETGNLRHCGATSVDE